MRKMRRQIAKVMTAANGPVESTYTNDDVSERIRSTLAAAIGEGALKPCTKILEEAIAEHFGVSRTVVRAAVVLAVLFVQGHDQR
ncbi:GntR family transcriptional regulator, partial [Rhizobium leguminosarum]|uniref:GntR family transcriptional regulator n=1 Tax=Rhizobium leguminosarum TaxID=384 RepID=UPI003F9C3A50